jgi:hypothetical protein
MPLLDVKVGVWCAVSAARIISSPTPFFFGDRVFTLIFCTLIFSTLQIPRKTISLLAIQGKQFCVLFVFVHARIISEEFGLVRQT